MGVCCAWTESDSVLRVHHFGRSGLCRRRDCALHTGTAGTRLQAEAMRLLSIRRGPGMLCQKKKEPEIGAVWYDPLKCHSVATAAPLFTADIAGQPRAAKGLEARLAER